jgi:hypothetical protein
MVPWRAACTDWKGVKRLNDLIVRRTPGYFLARTADYRRLWLNRERMKFGDLPDAIVRLYAWSLLILRTHIGSNGAVVAANDSDFFNLRETPTRTCSPGMERLRRMPLTSLAVRNRRRSSLNSVVRSSGGAVFSCTTTTPMVPFQVLRIPGSLKENFISLSISRMRPGALGTCQAVRGRSVRQSPVPEGH